MFLGLIHYYVFCLAFGVPFCMSERVNVILFILKSSQAVSLWLLIMINFPLFYSRNPIRHILEPFSMSSMSLNYYFMFFPTLSLSFYATFWVNSSILFSNLQVVSIVIYKMELIQPIELSIQVLYFSLPGFLRPPPIFTCSLFHFLFVLFYNLQIIFIDILSFSLWGF